MIAQRVGATALRRVATKPSNAFFTQNLVRAALASNLSATQSRPVTTQKLTPNEGNTILDQQRLLRPVSPHLEIYDKKQTYFGGSIWQRFTGAGLSGALYVYAAAYLTAPLLGWHLESQSLVAAFAALPVAAKTGVKFVAAWPLVFHFYNGIRHLVYDLAIGFSKKTIIQGGYMIWGASVVTTVGLLFL
ncbi:hypothetical protein QBC33DRAFT_570960 [Phialemonium atrogriseum]|uniref:Succinate dehydrogenase cytochrome b560 subunit n=1 Tax=Phialemonium atrogriseum TaxID=1093897 RepID=A0AAJ0BXE5_9PEZI|nr:uncharacterized protein QBC33DRAFT_570960 [Phialemonium atrogriseum]KAK1766250.1 hypothetical protein QBC33DRAFT_570960 [Phialemonium atrogriseum]